MRRVVFGDQREDITGDLHVTIYGAHEETINGEDTSYHLGKNSQAYFLGHRAEMFAGAQEEVYIGSKLEVAAGMRTELALVAALAIRGGVTLDMFLGPAFNFHTGFSFEKREMALVQSRLDNHTSNLTLMKSMLCVHSDMLHLML